MLVALWLLLRLTAGADGVEALHLAIAEGDVIAVCFLLRNGAPVNKALGSYTPLHVAAQMDRGECAKLVSFLPQHVYICTQTSYSSAIATSASFCFVRWHILSTLPSRVLPVVQVKG